MLAGTSLLSGCSLDLSVRKFRPESLWSKFQRLALNVLTVMWPHVALTVFVVGYGLCSGSMSHMLRSLPRVRLGFYWQNPRILSSGAARMG